jgi:hypothetical protein
MVFRAWTNDILEHYRDLYCRICHLFDCPTHGNLVATCAAAPNRPPQPSVEPCGPNCHRHLLPSKPPSSPSDWTDVQIALARSLLALFGNDYCSVAQTLYTHTCAEVFALAQSMSPPSVVDDPPASPEPVPARMNHGCYAGKVTVCPSRGFLFLWQDFGPRHKLCLADPVPAPNSVDPPVPVSGSDTAPSTADVHWTASTGASDPCGS